MFLDIEGTLIPGKAQGAQSDRTAAVPADVAAGLEALAGQGVYLFFATTLPYRAALERCRGIRHLFAGGAHLVLEGEREIFYALNDSWIPALSSLGSRFQFRMLTYRNDKKLYKVTLFRPARRPWTWQEAETVAGSVDFGSDAIRYFIESNCLQIVSADAGKANGVERICCWLDIAPEETAAAGDSREDEEMMKLCNGGC